MNFKYFLKISWNLEKIIFSLISFLFVVSLAFAEEIDFSLITNQNSFLSPESLQKQNQILKDFIFPLAFDQKQLDDFIDKIENEKKTKSMKNSGWYYVVKKGESLWEISRKFKVSLNDILAVNNLKENSIVKAGDKLIIPGVKPQVIISAEKPKNLTGKFVNALQEIGGLVIPVSGFNWGNKHSNNGTDIAAQCGQPVYAANSGIVVESSDGWNNGYGNYIIIKHKNSIYTLYGHLSLRVVEIGDEVAKGELIGYVGNTGHTIGPTGCHLHFEIRGATNPLLK